MYQKYLKNVVNLACALEETFVDVFVRSRNLQQKQTAHKKSHLSTAEFVTKFNNLIIGSEEV